MTKKTASGNHNLQSAEPRVHQRGREIQSYGTVTHAFHLEFEEPVRLEMTEQLNQLLADTMTLRDLYKKSHWQVVGPTFYQLHLLFDKHFDEQVEMVDTVAERIQLLGGLAIAMAHDVAETTRIERPPRGREEVPVLISRPNADEPASARTSGTAPTAAMTKKISATAGAMRNVTAHCASSIACFARSLRMVSTGGTKPSISLTPIDGKNTSGGSPRQVSMCRK